MLEDVKIVKLVTHKDERGFFREIFRFQENFKDYPIGQLSHSEVKKGIIKAWHGHVYQSQWNYVITGQIKVVLFDNRKESSTYREIKEFITGSDKEPLAYFFPPGVFHGYKCIQGPMQIIYVTSGIYDLNDEIRNTNNDLKIDYKW